jgi:hypothetical protein
MVNLKRGTVVTDKIMITPDTKPSDIAKTYKDCCVFSTPKFSNKTDIKITNGIVIGKDTFDAVFHFNEDEMLESIQISPVIEYDNENLIHSERRKIHRVFCSEWLSQYASYQKPTSIIKLTYRSNHDMCDGPCHGYIWINFVQKS